MHFICITRKVTVTEKYYVCLPGTFNKNSSPTKAFDKFELGYYNTQTAEKSSFHHTSEDSWELVSSTKVPYKIREDLKYQEWRAGINEITV